MENLIYISVSSPNSQSKKDHYQPHRIENKMKIRAALENDENIESNNNTVKNGHYDGDHLNSS